MIDYIEKQNILGLLLVVDFEKAFDTLEWTFVKKTLSSYNFEESITCKSWIKLFYNDILSCIQNNGFPSFFLNSVEELNNTALYHQTCLYYIRNNDVIEGMYISDSECKISQYTDDATLILDGTDNSVRHSLSLLDSFAELSGLVVNYEKTEALWIGSLRLQRRTIETNKNILWSFRKVRALGVWLSTIKEESAMLNFQEKKEKISKIINNCQFRRLSLLKKIKFIKSLLALQLASIQSPLPTPSYLKEINSL